MTEPTSDDLFDVYGASYRNPAVTERWEDGPDD